MPDDESRIQDQEIIEAVVTLALARTDDPLLVMGITQSPEITELLQRCVALGIMLGYCEPEPTVDLALRALADVENGEEYEISLRELMRDMYLRGPTEALERYFTE